MTVIVRDFRAGDAEGFARIRHLALPFILSTPEAITYDAANAHPDAHFQPLVAEEDGELVGTAQVGIVYDSPQPGQGYLNVYVHPDRQGRGAGSLLVRTAEERLVGLDVTRFFVRVVDEPTNRAFAEKRGYLPAAPRTSSAWTWRPAHCRRARSRPRTSNCARPRTSPTIPARCSTWTRRRWRTNRATSPTSSRTTRPG